MSRPVETERMPPSDYKADCSSLSSGALRLRYPREYSSWKNMKSRCTRGLGVLHPDFEEFRSFLALVGPRPEEGHSLDRRDHTNPMYGPGLVDWADAKTQANNRSSTHLVNIDGLMRPLSQVAREQGVKPDTARKRIRRGWSVTAAISDRNQTSDRASQQWPGPQDPERIAAFERSYMARPISAEGETRADFYIRETRVQIGLKRQFIATSERMLGYLIDGHLPDGATSIDMEWQWEKEFGGIDADALKQQVAADYAFVEIAEARIAEALSLRPTSKWTRSRSDRR